MFLSFLLSLEAGVGLAGPVEGVLINRTHSWWGDSGGWSGGLGGRFRLSSSGSRRGRLIFSLRGLRSLFRLGLLGVLRGHAAIEPVVDHGRLLISPAWGRW